MDHSRALAPSPFPGDSGEATAEVRAKLAAATGSGEPYAYLAAVAALCGERLLVPVVATATRVGAAVGGLSSDKEAEMAVVLLEAADGRRAMLGFTGTDSMSQWQAGARPVPVTLDVAARTTVGEGASALVIDVAGPHPLSVEGDVLTALAVGHRLVELAPGEFGWAVPAGAAAAASPAPPGG